MILFKIENSYTQLVNLTEQTRELARSVLSYHDQEIAKEIRNLFMQIQFANRRGQGGKVAFFKKRIGELRPQEHVCLLDSGGFFPTGLMFLVEDALKEHGIGYRLDDLREKPKKYINYPWHSDMKLRYYQIEAIEAAKAIGRGVIESAVGSGKTACMQELVKWAGVRTLVITPAKDLQNQLIESFSDVFGVAQIGEINTLNVKKAKKQKNIRFVTVQTLASLRKQGLLSDVISDIDMVIIEEFHHAGANSYVDLLKEFNHVYYKYGFTGTFIRNDSKTLPMWGFCSNVLYRYPASLATKDGFLTPLKVVFHEVHGISNKNYQTEYSKNYCNNKELLLKIKSIFENHISKNDQVLILVKRKDTSGKIINEFLEEIGIENTFISGDSDKKTIKKAIKDFNDKKIKVLLGSQIIGEGIDIKSTNHLLFLQGGKSPTNLIQALGRCVRLFPEKKVAYAHDILFTGTCYLELHAAERLKTYEESFEPLSIEII